MNPALFMFRAGFFIPGFKSPQVVISLSLNRSLTPNQVLSFKIQIDTSRRNQ
jgi:hypothetical protein